MAVLVCTHGQVAKELLNRLQRKLQRSLGRPARVLLAQISPIGSKVLHHESGTRTKLAIMVHTNFQ